MSGQQLGTVLGGAIGAFFGPTGIQIGMAVGGVAGSLLMPDKVGLQDQEGQRLKDLKVTYSSYGLPINKNYGTNRIGGQVIWARNIKETRHVREEEVGKGGSETYDVIWYTYSVDMAIGLCEGEIDDIIRVWAGGVLIYDVNQGGWSNDFVSTDESSGNIKFYYGSNTQEVDWYIQSFEEDTPAYRNLAYIRFTELQLGMFGNRIPNITCEVARDTDKSTIPLQNIVSPTITGYPYYSLMLNVNGDKLETLRSGYEAPGYDYRGYDNFSVTEGIYVFQDGISVLYDDSDCIASGKVSANVPLYGQSLNGGYIAKRSSNFNTQHDYYYLQKNQNTCVTESSSILANVAGSGYVNADAAQFFVINDNEYYLYQPNEELIHKFPNGDTVSVTIQDFPNVSSSSGVMFTYYNNILYLEVMDSNENIVIEQYTNNLEFIRIDAIERERSTFGNPGFISVDMDGIHVLQSSLYIQIDFDLNILRDIDTTFTTDTRDRPPTNYLFSRGVAYGMNLDGVITREFVNATSENGQTLSSIVEDLLLSSGIELSEMDLSDGNSTFVYGFVKANTSSARVEIAVLQSIYLFDLVEENFQIVLKMRKEEIPSKYYTEDHILEDVEIINTLQTELPKKVSIEYSDKDMDYQQSSQSFLRIDGNSLNNINLKIPISESGEKIKQLVEKVLFSSWAASTRLAFEIPFNPDLSVSDVVSIEYENIIYIVRINSLTITDTYFLQCEAYVESNNIYESTASSDEVNFNNQEIALSQPTFMRLFNAPTLDNTLLNNASIYYGVHGFNNSWKGCEVFRSKNNESTYETIGVSLEQSVFGTAHTKLEDGPTTTWDLVNTVILISIEDGFTSSTIEEIYSGINYIMIGSEVLQYMDYVDNTDGTYTLSNFLRGRRGTEWATDTHEIAEGWVLLDNSINATGGTINKKDYYKPVTFNTFIDNTSSSNLTCDGTNLMPYSPSALSVDGFDISWLRRDRYVSGYFDPLPMSEQIERYRIEFINVDVVQGTVYVDDQTNYTYSDLYGTIDRIKVSQYSSLLSDYGYEAEVIL